MGVTQLWSVLQPCARPTRLETLNRKRLAVDASIWIYQFLKAVRDKEGNALRNSHVVGFFRRICKLLFFGIKPVFVFDGGAPSLKRQTILGRKRRREGRRDDAARTAGKLLAVQMQRRAEDAENQRKRQIEVRGAPLEDQQEELMPDESSIVYAEEIGMSQQERRGNRKFVKKDPYHLPDLGGSIESMGQPDDPRIMSLEELQEFSRQHSSGENIDVYDFSKIDFDGEFFKSLPAVDRYNILNAARLRSRLRMGLSKEQLEELFPDRMAFSRFQVERVRERNELTQRLMNLNGMNSDDAMYGVGGGRIASDRGREYILVKNDGVEGGWALGVVSKDKNMGERNKPIDVDALPSRNARKKVAEENSDEDDEFEDVPVEGLNRLPKITTPPRPPMRQVASCRTAQPVSVESLFDEHAVDGGDSLFVEQDPELIERERALEEEAELQRAIEMSKEKNFAGSKDNLDEENADFEDVHIPNISLKQNAPEDAPPSQSTGEGVISTINKRANAVSQRQKLTKLDDSSDDGENLQDILAAGRRARAELEAKLKEQGKEIDKEKKGLFDGRLPFERISLRSSLFGIKKKSDEPTAKDSAPVDDEDDEQSGGFEREREAPRPLPPWLINTGDIREEVKEQKTRAQEVDTEDHETRLAEEEADRASRDVIEVASSDDGSDVEMLDGPPVARVRTPSPPSQYKQAPASAVPAMLEEKGGREKDERNSPASVSMSPATEHQVDNADAVTAARYSSLSWEEVEEEFEGLPEAVVEGGETVDGREGIAPESDISDPLGKVQALPTEDAGVPKPLESAPRPSDAREFAFGGNKQDIIRPEPGQDAIKPSVVAPPGPATQEDFDFPDDYDEFTDPEEEELMARLDLEAEEHARFASTLNHKSAEENQAEYERELKQLRAQQKKDRRDADEVSQVMITECQALLRLFGLPYITAPMEAEAQCAELVNLGLVDGIVTDDSDIFLFGGTRVYKNMFNSNKFVECYLLSDLEKELSLSRDKLIEFAHLLGSDYTEGLSGIGPVTALEIISEFPSDNCLQGFRDWWFNVQHNNRSKEADAKNQFRRKFRRTQATKLFLPPGFPNPAVTEAYLKPDVDATPDPFQWGVPDLDNLRSFLMATIGWTQDRTDEVLVPVIKDMNRREVEGTQTNITRYFGGAVGVGAKGPVGRNGTNKVGSTRITEAMRRLKARADGDTESATSADVEVADTNELDSKNKRKKAISGDLTEAASAAQVKSKGKGRGGKRAKVAM